MTLKRELLTHEMAADLAASLRDDHEAIAQTIDRLLNDGGAVMVVTDETSYRAFEYDDWLRQARHLGFDDKT